MIVNRKPDALPQDAALSISSSAERRAKLNSQLEDYFARGGEVRVIDQGVRTLEFSIEQPRRLDGSVPRLSKRSKYKIDTNEMKSMLLDGKSWKEICAHYMAKFDCSQILITQKISKLRSEIERDMRERAAHAVKEYSDICDAVSKIGSSEDKAVSDIMGVAFSKSIDLIGAIKLESEQ